MDREMFQKLKEICRLNKNKEKLMSTTKTTTDTRTVKALRVEVKTQKELNTPLLLRMNTLADQVSGLKSDLTRFKTNVADDVKYLTTRVDE